jgi:exonuclease III
MNMIFEKTIEQMPDVFTSFEFNKKAVKNGYPTKLLKNKGLSRYIKKYATLEYPGAKTWSKNKKQNELFEIDINQFKETAARFQKMQMTDEQMIQHLKAKGYKIMKPQTEWKEV